MNKKSTRPLVPKLRFPEFRDAGEWEEIKLIDTASKKIKWSFIGGPFGSNLKSSDYTKTGVRIIQLQNIGDAEFFDTYKIFTSEEKADELLSCNIYPDEIILSKMGDPVGRACFIPNNHPRYVMCADGIRLVVDEKLYSKYFIYSLINSVQFRSLIKSSSTGSTRKRIGLDVLKNLLMVVPKKKEQQKIADCLSSLDDLITAEAQKLDALKDHKKGLMQQLFPAEGETVPKLRFPEFRGKGEWGFRILGEFINERNLLLSGKVTLFSLTIENGITPKTERYERSFLVNNEDDAYKEVFPNDFAYNPMNLRFGAIARHAGTEKVALSKYYDIFYCDDSVDVKFCENYFKSFSMIDFYNKVAIGSLIEKRRVHFSQFLRFEIRFPSLPEQQKIADCLSYLDELISAQSNKIDVLKAHKKGLMQQLFPSVDEVDA